MLSLSITAVAVLGIALIAMGEDIGTDMSFRTFGHLVSNIILIVIVILLFCCTAEVRFTTGGNELV